jgi:hypothetical protein
MRRMSLYIQPIWLEYDRYLNWPANMATARTSATRAVASAVIPDRTGDAANALFIIRFTRLGLTAAEFDMLNFELTEDEQRIEAVKEGEVRKKLATLRRGHLAFNSNHLCKRICSVGGKLSQLWFANERSARSWNRNLRHRVEINNRARAIARVYRNSGGHDA